MTNALACYVGTEVTTKKVLWPWSLIVVRHRRRRRRRRRRWDFPGILQKRRNRHRSHPPVSPVLAWTKGYKTFGDFIINFCTKNLFRSPDPLKLKAVSALPEPPFPQLV